MTLSPTMRATLARVAAEPAGLSSPTKRDLRTLEVRQLVEAERPDDPRSPVWTWRVTDKGREALAA